MTGARGSGTGDKGVGDDLSVRIACRMYRLALALGLGADAERLGPEMLQTFRALCRSRRPHTGAASLLAFAAAECVNVVLTALRRHRGPAVSGAVVAASDGVRGQAPRGRRGRSGTGRLRRSARLPRLVDGLAVDVRVAQRVLRRRPGFTAAAVATLAVGIGSTTAIFTVVDHLLLRPLPFPEPERLVEVWSSELEGAGGAPLLSAAARRAWAETAGLFERIEAFQTSRRVLAGESPEQLSVTALTPGLGDLLGARPASGRLFVAADADPASQPPVVLSDGFWRRRLGADPGVIGRTLRLDDTVHVIVGVMPREFAFPTASTDVWVPLPRDAAGYPIARLAPGVDVERAQERADRLAPGLWDAGLAEPGWGLLVFSLRESFIFSVNRLAVRGLWVLFGAVGFVLLIATANVASLTLSQTTARGHELAMRLALGARRARVVRQLLIEGALLGTSGAALGTLLAAWSVRLAAATTPERLSFLTEHPIFVDGRVVLFALGVAGVATLLFALLPAARVAGPRRLAAYGAERGSTAARHRQTLRGLLVVAEVALASVLLVGAGLLVRSMAALLAVDPGYETEVTVVTLSPSPARYSSAAAQRSLLEQLEEIGRSLPGVEVAAVTNGAPPWLGSLSSANRAEAEGQPPPLGVNRGVAVDASGVEFLNVVNVSVDYFRVMGIPLLAGRAFTASDDAADVAIISEDFARRFWHGASPLGKRLRMRQGEPWVTIVGVVPDVLQTGLDDARGELEIYYPASRMRPGYPRLNLVLRGDLSGESLGPALRQGVRAIDPQLPVESITRMEELLYGDLAGARFNMVLLGGFACTALALAAIGIYGVLAYSVVQRRREIGIRRAIGATGVDLLGRVVLSGMRLVSVGLALGGVGAWQLTRFMESLLFEIEPLDSPTLAAAATLLVAVALLACLIPALRATYVDPMAVLRGD